MWPFRSNYPVRYESPGLVAFETSVREMKQIIMALEAGNVIDDELVRKTYFGLFHSMQSNCDSVASGLFVAMGAICVHKNNLIREFLPSALRPIYHLGIEDLDGVRSFIRSVAREKRSNLDLQTVLGRGYLDRIADDHSLIVDSFRKMYREEDNSWRSEDDDVPEIPPILVG